MLSADPAQSGGAPLPAYMANKPAAPTSGGYNLGDTFSGSGVPTGSTAAKAAQGALENPVLPSSQSTLSSVAAQYPTFNQTLNNLLAPRAQQQQGSLDTDPSVALARALENQGIGSLDAWLKNAREQAIIGSGDPALASQAGFGLDPQAATFAQQNYLSGNADLARVKRAQDLAHKAIIDRLAAHGILNSGELGYQEGQSNIDYGNKEYDVRQAVLQKLADYAQQALDRKTTLKNATLQAIQNAYAQMAANPPAYSGGTNQPWLEALKAYGG